MTAGFFEFFNFRLSGSLSTLNDGACVTHSFTRWCGSACNKSCDRFFNIVFNPIRSFVFFGTTDFSNENNTFGFWVVIKHFNHIEM